MPSTSLIEEIVETCILIHNSVLHVLSQVMYFCGTFYLSNRKVETKKKSNSQISAIIQKMFINCEIGYTLCYVDCFISTIKWLKYFREWARILLIINSVQWAQTRIIPGRLTCMNVQCNKFPLGKDSVNQTLIEDWLELSVVVSCFWTTGPEKLHAS